MRRLVTILGAILLSSATLAAQTSPADGTKIAFVNTTAVLQGTAEGKQKLAQLEQFVSQQQQQLEQQRSELQTLREQYDSQYRMLNPQTAGEMQSEIQQKERALRRAQEDIELDINRRRNELLGQMSQKIQNVIAQYAQDNGIGVVFQETPTLPYYTPALDITADIIQIYDEQNPVEGGGTPAAASEAPASSPN